MVQPPGPPPPPSQTSGPGAPSESDNQAQIQWEIGVLASYFAMTKPGENFQNILASIQAAQAAGASPSQLANRVNSLITQLNATNPEGGQLPSFQFGSATNSSNYASYAQTLIVYVKAAEQNGQLTATQAQNLISQLQNFSQNANNNVPPENALLLNDIIYYVNYTGQDYKNILPDLNIQSPSL